MKNGSFLGMWFAGVYVLVVLIASIYAVSCSGMFCGMVIVIPVMPWVFLLEGVVDDSLGVFVVLAVINAALFYMVGAFLGKKLR